MPLLEILAIAVGLAMDAFAVSLAAGAGAYVNRPRPAVRLAFHLGLFQFMMPVLGWYLGSQTVAAVASVDHWVAFGLLAFVGTRMVKSGFSHGEGPHDTDPSRGLTLVSLSVATSIDALAVGISLALLQVDIWYPSVVIGVVTSALSLIGLRLGAHLSRRFGKGMEIAGGILLILIGLRILVEHLGA